MERLLRRVRERQRTIESEPGPAEAPARPAGGDPPDTGIVQVISGASVQSFALAGLQVNHACTVLASIIQIDRNAPVLVNGRRVRASHRLASGDTLEFVHHAGEKGASRGRALRDRRVPGRR